MNVKITTIYIAISLLIIACTTTKNVEQSPNNAISKIDSLIQSEHQNNRFDGTIVIGTKDKILYQKAIGIANRTWDISMENDTRFDIASLNKAFSAALIVIAEEEGKLTTNDKLADYFPKANFDKNITLHDMMTHTSGLPNYNDMSEDLKANYYKKFKRLHFSNEEYIEFIANLPMIGKPKEQFYYSNFAYHILPIILEKIYDKSYNEILQEKICQPLKMTNTFTESSNEIVHKKVAEAYSFDKGENHYYSNNFIDLTLGRRIFSTSEDLYKWSKGLSSGKILAEKSYQKIATNYTSTIDKNIAYGYGWVVNDGGNYKMGNLEIDKKYLVHGGSTEGFKAMLTNINEGEFIIAHLSNIGNQTNEFKLTKRIVDILLQQK